MVKVGQKNIRSLVKALKQVLTVRLTQGPRSKCKFDPVRAVEKQGARYHSLHSSNGHSSCLILLEGLKEIMNVVKGK